MAVRLGSVDLVVRKGALRPRRVRLLAESVGNVHVNEKNPVEAYRIKHRYVRALVQGSATAVTDQRFPRHQANSRGTIAAFFMSAKVAAIGDSTCQAKLYKNGVLVTGSTLTLDSGDAAMAVIAATFTPPNDAYSEGDVFEIAIDATVGTGTLAQGIAVTAIFDENPR